MNQQLTDNNYIVIPNFISPYRANKLKEDYLHYAESNNLNGDEQVPNSSSIYNYISFLELLCEKTPEVSEILEEPVLPTYAYSRVYRQNSILDRHVDRDSCEISLTVHLGGDNSWPIWIVSPEGDERCIELNPGDAMLYLGKIAEHWRNTYDGNEYVQVFLHYVRSKGDCSYAYFDKKKSKEEIEISLDENEKEKLTIMTVNSKSKLENFIQIFDDILPEDECRLILDEYIDSSCWQHATTREGLYQDVRNCMEIPISSDYIINENFHVRKNLDHIIFKGVEKAIKKYTSIFKSFNIDVDTGYQLLRYDEGGFYSQHTDSFKEQQRSLSCAIQLNDDYDGGYFSFFDGELSYKLNKGSAILFPSNFMYPHEITPITRGTRYSIITWLV